MARKPPAPARRAAALVFGLRAEAVAALWLVLKGYRILERRYAVGGGELDLIAARGEVVAFVEVKARRLLDDAMTAVTVRKRGRMHRAVRHWLARNPWAVHRVLRGDAVFVAPRRLPKHLVNAFELDVL